MARHVRQSSTGTKRTVSGAKSSRSSASSDEPRQVRRARHVVCVDNEGYEASLERRKIYNAIVDTGADRAGMVRVVDESGEDYLFPKECFAEIKVTPQLAKVLGTSR